MRNGKHRGSPITEIPVDYLRWMINIGHDEGEFAQAELKRRGTVIPNVTISGHAIDRASQRVLNLWKKDHRKNEGLHAWLVRKAELALKRSPGADNIKIRCEGIFFTFKRDGKWPVLLTVARALPVRHENVKNQK